MCLETWGYSSKSLLMVKRFYKKHTSSKSLRSFTPSAPAKQHRTWAFFQLRCIGHSLCAGLGGPIGAPTFPSSAGDRAWDWDLPGRRGVVDFGRFPGGWMGGWCVENPIFWRSDIWVNSKLDHILFAKNLMPCAFFCEFDDCFECLNGWSTVSLQVVMICLMIWNYNYTSWDGWNIGQFTGGYRLKWCGPKAPPQLHCLTCAFMESAQDSPGPKERGERWKRIHMYQTLPLMLF